MFELIILTILLIVGARTAVVVGPKIHQALSKVTNIHLFYLGVMVIVAYGAMQILSGASVSLSAYSETSLDNPLAHATSAIEEVSLYVLYLGAAMIPLSFIVKLFEPRSKNQKNADVK